MQDIANRLKEIITNDDHTILEEFMNDFNLSVQSEMYNLCAEKLAINCFQYLLGRRPEHIVRSDNNFTRQCSIQAQAKCNFDGRPLWENSHKRNARTPAPSQYIEQWGHSVSESVFYTALLSGALTNNKEKSKQFVKMLMMNTIPIGDHTYYSVNEDNRIQGYVCMLHKYLHQDAFTTYARKKKQNLRETFV